MVWKPSKPMVILSAIGTVVGGSLFIKEYTGGPRYENKTRADGKIVIITGANTGIGKETARELALRGATVVMACRDIQKCEKSRQEIVLESKNKYVYCRKCDLASLASVRKFCERFKNALQQLQSTPQLQYGTSLEPIFEHKRLDVLINNAGVMRCPQSRTEDGIETQLGVNHMGHFLLTNLLLDMIKASAPSRIVNVSSIAHKRGKINIEDLNSEKQYDPGEAYNQSKLANVLFTKELAKRLEGTAVTVNAVHPGIVDTEITRHMSFYNSSISAIFLKPFVKLFIKNPRKGAQTTIYVALDESLQSVSGKYFSNCKEDDVGPQGNDDITAKWLWLVSEKWTNLNI